MSVLKLKKFCDDDSSLVDEGDAEFLQRKVGVDTVLDFSEVVQVSPRFLDILLQSESPESMSERIVGQNQTVDEALARWVERRSTTIPPAQRPPLRPKAKTQPPPKPLHVERAPTSDDRYTPTRLVRRLKEALRGYIESAYPLNDSILVKARRVLLEQDAGGHLLSQEPFIETTPRYASSTAGYLDLGLPEHIGKLFDRLSRKVVSSQAESETRTVLYPTMYKHQEEAFRAFLTQGRDIVVATGTGSGKTECFLVPMLGALYDEAFSRPTSFERPGVRALILYPMNALVNDQLTRLRLLFGDPAVAEEFGQVGCRRFPRFGMYTGRTPYAGIRNADRDRQDVAPLLQHYLDMDPDLQKQLRQLGKYPSKDLTAFFAKHEEQTDKYKTGQKKGKTYTKYNWERRLHTGPTDRELLTRHEMVHGVGTLPGHSPEILVTNYSMLEYMLMRPFERPIFEETRRWLELEGNQLLFVIDEAHMYRGAKGAEVAFLFRRLQARLGCHNRPEKFRVLATSATLGSSEEEMKSIRCFAADLTGKGPESFDTVIGRREFAAPADLASEAETELFASLNLDKVHSLSSNELRQALDPLFSHYQVSCDSTDEKAILSTLHRVLSPKPYVNKLINEAAGTARALGSLAEQVFPPHSQAKRALEALLTLGALARPTVDSPGLVPTRVHAMFRGVHGLYACLNPRCRGRQEKPGEEATMGKLFSVPQIRCDECGSRVFELASCRSCGTPYVVAYAESGSLPKLGFLWGETEGNLQRIELLPLKPRYPESTEEIEVHLKTGFVDVSGAREEDHSRSLFLWLDSKNERQPVFGRCAMCQPVASARSHIYDFRTRGEQPFTALIEAQFAEQPPQKSAPQLMNAGRKVLVFSDGRQKAARLAPALEYNHARDLFRQVVALATHELGKLESKRGMHYLYPAVVWLCSNRGYDLFPSADEVEFHNHLRKANKRCLPEVLDLANRGWFKPTETFAKVLYNEVTDRYYSLASLALGTIEENPDLEFVFHDFPDVGLDRAAVKVLFRAWLRLHLERRSFRTDGAELRALGEGWAQPEGINAQNSRQVLPYQFEEYLSKIFGEDSEALKKVREWFQILVRNSDLMEFEGDLYYLSPRSLSLNLRLDAFWFRCKDCGRIHPEALAELCPGCLGCLVEADEEYLSARTGYYRDQVKHAFDDSFPDPFGLTAAEHSAQLTAVPDESAFTRVEEYELRFQDILLTGKPPIDVLSCTTTMEVGIDIGALSGVALRNVPPHVANYQQRAGRAGRRGRSIASVITYAHGTSHDAHFFDHPEAIISGTVRPPVVYVENQKVLERHIHAYLIQRFFHEMVPVSTTTEAYRLFESLGTVEQFLSDRYPCSLPKLETWLRTNEVQLCDELRRWVPEFSYGENEVIEEVADTISGSVSRLLQQLRSVLPVEDYPRRETLTGLVREALERRLEENLLATLIGQAIFPRYAFPTDVVSFWVPKPRRTGDPSNRLLFEYEPQRDLQLALSEYAPTRSLTIDKWRFESAALFSPYETSPARTLEKCQPYSACKACTYVSLEVEVDPLEMCPCCGSDQIDHSYFITPVGFAPDVNERREVDHGQAISYAGKTDHARLELQDPPGDWDAALYDKRLLIWTGARKLAMVNKGVGDRGFRVCPECGRSEPEYGPQFTQTKLTKGGVPVSHRHPLKQGVTCTGNADGPFYLGHQFPTDALLIRIKVESPVRLGGENEVGLLSRAARMALTSLVEAMCQAASRELQIDEGELSGWWAPVLGGHADEAQIYLYDLLPGGAGYAREVGKSIESVFRATEQLLQECECAQSCYRCLRHYGNSYIHASLDRHLALALLKHIKEGAVPTVSAAECDSALQGLNDLLAIQNIQSQQHRTIHGVDVSLIVTHMDREIWVDVNHPLVDPSVRPSRVVRKARESFVEIVEIDSFTLVHDLPLAISRLNLGGLSQ